VTNISQSFYLQDGGKNQLATDMEQNYVTVTLRIVDNGAQSKNARRTIASQHLQIFVTSNCPLTFVLTARGTTRTIGTPGLTPRLLP